MKEFMDKDFMLYNDTAKHLFIKFPVAVSQGIYRYPRGKIQILLSFGIIDIYALSMVYDHGIPVIRMQQIAVS